MNVDFNEEIFNPKRFLIMTVLFIFRSMAEGDLVKLTGIDWGSLSTHLSRLENAGYIERKKAIVRGRVRTVVKITEKGYSTYVNEVKKIKSLVDKIGI